MGEQAPGMTSDDKNYSHILQIGITLILLVAASIVVWRRAGV